MGLARGFAESFLAWVVGLLVLGFPPQSPQSLPYSALPLELLGVIVNTATPSKSVCLVRSTYPLEMDGTFRPGQTAFDFAEIKEIRRDGVIIHNLVTNRPELLTFPDTKPPATTQPPPPPPVLTTSSDVVTVDLPKGSVDHYLENLPALLESAFAAPRYREAKNGEKSIEGFEIGRIREASVVEQMGLRNGDVILELNGERLDSLATVIRLLGQIQNMPQARMTVLRNGQRMNFIFNRK